MDYSQAAFSVSRHPRSRLSLPSTSAASGSGQSRKQRIFRSVPILMGCLTLGLFAGYAHASTINNSATFTNDSQVDLVSVVVGQSSTVTIETDSYGGGTLGGVTTAAGGFVPILTLFGPTGNFLLDDGGDATCQAGMNADPTTSICNDAEISTTLGAGTYELAVTEFYNYPAGLTLSSGFSTAGNFTEDSCGATSGAFYEVDLTTCPERDGNVAFTETVTPLAVTATPEPATIWLSALPIVALCFARWRQVTVRA